MSTLHNDPLAPPPRDVEMKEWPEGPSLDDLVTEDGKPVDRIYTEKQYRLLTHPLYANWAGPGPDRTFLVLVNVGWFFKDQTSAVVPDCLLSLDVTCPDDLHTKVGHSYYQWKMGKSPEVVIEIVSDTTGGEDTLKMRQYARLGVSCYAILDPEHFLSEETLRLWQRRGPAFERIETGFWPEIGLGLILWEGAFEGHTDVWLRWCDDKGQVIPTAEESAQAAKERPGKQKKTPGRRKSAPAREERVRELEEALQRRNGASQDPPPAT